MTLISIQRALRFVAAASCTISTWGQQPPSNAPVEDSNASAPTKPQDPVRTGGEATPSDAEKITRLQRSIAEDTQQVEELNAKLNDPASEYAQAESAFTALDEQLAELKKDKDAAGDDAARTAELQKTLDELEAKHRLAKDRFDLAIRERKTLQEQIKTLQQKIAQDTDALKRLKGEAPSTTQPAPQSPAASPSESPAAPATAPPHGGPASDAAAPPAVTPPAPAAPPAEKTAAPAAPAPEVVEAREEAAVKKAEAETAAAEVASVEERIAALNKSIELEHRLVETSRKKVANAQSAERTLYDELQKKWQDGSPRSELDALREQIDEARERLREAESETQERTERLSSYQAELASLQTEHIAAIEEAQERQAEAAQAQKRVEHLESPLSPRNLWRWFLQRGPKVGGIILAMIAVIWGARLAEGRMIRLIAGRSDGSAPEDRENRARTLVGVFHSAVAIAVYVGGGLMILTEVGINVVPLMGGAAVVGLAVAFGAQNLLRDYFYGFTILLENQYTIGDVVKVVDVSGQVERITLRCTMLRGLDGTVHFIPNGEIHRVSNMTHEWSRALFDIPIAYKEDVDRVMDELVELAKQLRRDPAFRGLILEMPEMLGVDEFADSAVVIKFFIKTRPLKQWTVKRELLRRIKRRFDELGIEIPYPHRTVYHRSDDGPNGVEPTPMRSERGRLTE